VTCDISDKVDSGKVDEIDSESDSDYEEEEMVKSTKSFKKREEVKIKPKEIKNVVIFLFMGRF
jgi:hypothetical protein